MRWLISALAVVMSFPSIANDMTNIEKRTFKAAFSCSSIAVGNYARETTEPVSILPKAAFYKCSNLWEVAARVGGEQGRLRGLSIEDDDVLKSMQRLVEERLLVYAIDVRAKMAIRGKRK